LRTGVLHNILIGSVQSGEGRMESTTEKFAIGETSYAHTPIIRAF
jgi:hypothetical protein